MGEAKRKREAAARAQTRDALGLPENDTPVDGLPSPSSAVEAFATIERSVSEMIDHMEEPSGRGRYRTEARHKLQAQHRVQIQIWIIQPARDFLWDSVDVAITDVAERDALLGKLVDHSLVESTAPADKLVSGIDARRTCPLFEMHPQRFCTLHPMGSFVCNYEAAPPFTHRAMEAFTEAYRRTSNAQLHSERLRIKRHRPSRQSQQVISLATFVHDFQRNGRNIFRFPARLIELFHRTDVDGIPLDELKLPYDGFYMYFGRQHELAVDGWAPDGAYVSQIGRPGDRVIQFAMTFAPDESIIYDHSGEYPEPVYIQAITEEQLKIGIGEAVDLVYSAKVAELKHQMEHGSRPETLAAAQRNAPPGVVIVDGVPKNAAAELEFIGGRHAEWHQVLRLLVNGLAYLSAYPEDRERRFGSAPPDLVNAATGNDAVAAVVAQNKLARLGYSAVFMCGARTEQASRDSPGAPDLGERESDQDFTWVRGHWRRQAHGPGRGLRTLRWLMPFKRYLNRPAAEQHGHVYLVGDEGA